MSSTVARRSAGAVDTTRKDARDALRAELARYSPSFAKVLPKHITPDRLVTLTLVAATTNPKLFECSPESIALSLMKISQWGLEIGRTAHLVPFYDKKAGQLQCTAIPDYKGLIELVLRGRHVKDIYARPAFDGEHFIVRYGTDERIEHHPNWSLRELRMAHVYSVAKLSEYRSTFEVMSKAEVDAIRGAAPSKDSPAWTNHYLEMAKKTVIKRLCKRLPQTPALEEALDADDLVDAPVKPLATATLADPYQLNAGTDGGVLPGSGRGEEDETSSEEQDRSGGEGNPQDETGSSAATEEKATGPQEGEILTLVDHAAIDHQTRSKVKGRVLRGMTAKEAVSTLVLLKGTIAEAKTTPTASTAPATKKPAADLGF